MILLNTQLKKKKIKVFHTSDFCILKACFATSKDKHAPKSTFLRYVCRKYVDHPNATSRS